MEALTPHVQNFGQTASKATTAVAGSVSSFINPLGSVFSKAKNNLQEAASNAQKAYA